MLGRIYIALSFETLFYWEIQKQHKIYMKDRKLLSILKVSLSVLFHISDLYVYVACRKILIDRNESILKKCRRMSKIWSRDIRRYSVKKFTRRNKPISHINYIKCDSLSDQVCCNMNHKRNSKNQLMTSQLEISEISDTLHVLQSKPVVVACLTAVIRFYQRIYLITGEPE